MGIKYVLQGKPLGHPSHPMFVHFPAALFPISILFDILSRFIDEPELVNAAFYNLAAGIAGALLATLTGFVDYFGMASGSRKRRVTTWHMLLNLVVIAIFAVSLGLRVPELDQSRTPLYLLFFSLAGLPVLIVGNYLGGELVYRMGMRVNTGRLTEKPFVLKAVDMVKSRFRVREPV